jgi:hypothetical protein
MTQKVIIHLTTGVKRVFFITLVVLAYVFSFTFTFYDS